MGGLKAGTSANAMNRTPALTPTTRHVCSGSVADIDVSDRNQEHGAAAFRERAVSHCGLLPTA